MPGVAKASSNKFWGEHSGSSNSYCDKSSCSKEGNIVKLGISAPMKVWRELKKEAEQVTKKLRKIPPQLKEEPVVRSTVVTSTSSEEVLNEEDMTIREQEKHQLPEAIHERVQGLTGTNPGISKAGQSNGKGREGPRKRRFSTSI